MRSAPAGYVVEKPLQTSPHSEVYAAVRELDGANVVLKTYLADRTGDAEARAAREIETLRRVAGPGVPRALDLDCSTEHPFLVLERLPGVPLARVMEERPIDLELWLRIALNASEILGRVHAARVVHKNLTPDNLLVDPADARVWLCDFGLAAELGAPERTRGLLSSTLAGALRYVSPEQTGRMNRGCDFRSDLYSFGATLYHALTGRPPFDVTDPLELIHSHLARVPRPAREVRADVPEVVSRLLGRLLRKEPEERYRSVRGLHADLQTCQARLTSTGSLSGDLELGANDVPDRPRFTERLYGRERESARMREIYTRAAAGQLQVLWIEGEPGAGKTALTESLHASLAGRGYLAVGKFDLYRDRAYAGWVAALGSLVQQILVESDEQLARWRSTIREGLGNIVGALVGLVPDLAFIVGDTPALPPLGPRETRARLSLALQRFVSACATPEHPLVLLLDDLQWSDAGSLELLEDLLSSGVPAAALVIGAWRSDLAEEAQPLRALAGRLSERGVSFERIELGPLGVDASVAMLADALERTPEDVRGFAELIERKTGNCALLVRQFIEHIHARGLLRYEVGAGWTWSFETVTAADIPEGAVAFMTAKIARLDAGARALLEFASCVGNEFDADLLCELSGRERQALERDLYTLCDAGLIAPCPLGFRFVHDRLREATQELLSDAARTRIHYDTARLLLERIAESERAAHVFEIVEHLNRGLPHLPEALRLTAIELNHQAASRSLGAGAAAAASGHLAVARELFREEDWSAHRALGLSIFLQSAESATQGGQFEAARELLDALDRRAPSRFEFAQIAVKRLQLLALLENPESCVSYILEVMRKLGVRWPRHPSALRARLNLRGIRWMLLRRRGMDILRPATSVDPHWLAPILVIGQSGSILIRYDVRLTALATCFVLRRYIRSGYIARAPFTLASYANWLQIIHGEFSAARRFAEVALALNDRVPDPVYGPRCAMQIHGMLYPWLMPRRQALAELDRVAEALREVGDPEYAYYTRFLKVSYGALAGDPVEQSERELTELAASVRRSGHSYPEPEQCQRAYGLLSRSVPQAVLASEIAAHNAWHADNPGWAQPFTATIWLLVLCVYGRYDLAFAQSERLEPELLRITPFVHVADHTFYRGLAAATLSVRTSGRAASRYARDLSRCLRRLHGWASGGPDFLHMATALEAERAALRRDFKGADRLYELATTVAKKQGFPHHAALAQERRARFLASLRRESEAERAFKEAIRLYRAWGAAPKAAMLEQRVSGGVSDTPL
jgi:predicted ATPase